MDWYINELSLSGQFSDLHSFKASLEPILQLRSREVSFKQQLYCSHTLHLCQVTHTLNLQQAVSGTGDKNFIRLVLSWLAKAGPFWDDERVAHEDDYFEYDDIDITDQGVGEAARRILIGLESSSYSFQKSLPPFMFTPLGIQHGLPEDPLGYIEIDNYWDVEQILAKIQTLKVYKNGSDVDAEIKQRFSKLIFSNDVLDLLTPVPFSKNVMERIFELLSVLDEVVAETETSGKLSSNGESILVNHFVGRKAWFTDESSTNKRNYEKDMTFIDPSDGSKKIFCSWHGKIKTPQIRIHFEWPRPDGQKKIKVVYIGPKITKT